MSNAPLKNTPVIHHVFFWLKNAGSIADRNELMSGLEQLRQISQVKKLWIGTPAITEDRTVVDASYDVSELIFFNSIEDEAIYQSHPIHLAFIQNCSSLWNKVVVYDTVVSERNN